MVLPTLSAIVLVALQATVGAPVPPDSATDAKVAAAAPASTQDAMICHTIVYTGTRFGSRECHTAREWKQMSTDAAAYIQNVQQRSQTLCYNGLQC